MATVTQRPKLTKAEYRTLAKFGITVDQHGRVVVGVMAGDEVVIETCDHRIFAMSASGSRRTMLSVHGQVNKATRIVGERNDSLPQCQALASIITE